MVNIDPTARFRTLNMQWPFPRAVDGRVLEPHRRRASRPRSPSTSSSPSRARTRPERRHRAAQRHQQLPHKVVDLGFSESDTQRRRLASSAPAQGTKLLHEVGAQPGRAAVPVRLRRRDPARWTTRSARCTTLAVVDRARSRHPQARFEAVHRHALDRLRGAGRHVPHGLVLAGLLGTRRQARRLPARNFFRGKIVVIGATASIAPGHPPDLDRHPMPGPEIQANAIEHRPARLPALVGRRAGSTSS